jgi:hypothetical protein
MFFSLYIKKVVKKNRYIFFVFKFLVFNIKPISIILMKKGLIHVPHVNQKDINESLSPRELLILNKVSKIV